MGLFSRKKEDTRHIADLDKALAEVNSFASRFRNVHFESLGRFEKNFRKEKSPADFQKERELFEQQLDILQKMKFYSDVVIDEAVRILRNETVLTEKDRIDIRKILEKKSPTDIRVKSSRK